MASQHSRAQRLTVSGLRPRSPRMNTGRGKLSTRNKRTARSAETSGGHAEKPMDAVSDAEEDDELDITVTENSMSQRYDPNKTHSKNKLDQKDRANRSEPPFSAAVPQYDDAEIIELWGVEAPDPFQGSNHEFTVLSKVDSSQHVPSMLSLTCNIEAGFRGPLRIEIPTATLAQPQFGPTEHVKLSAYHSDHIPSTEGTRPSSSTTQSLIPNAIVFAPRKRTHDGHYVETASLVRAGAPWPATATKSAPLKGWAILPAELRNRIYLEVFKHDQKLRFSYPSNFARSSQFLRVSRQVYEEGRAALYSLNSFEFQRNKGVRGEFWELAPKEIGFKDALRFLRMIGGNNVALLRDVVFVCEDALPSADRWAPLEARRFVQDANLHACLGVLARHGRLRALGLYLAGRKIVAREDEALVAALRKVRADDAQFIRNPHASGIRRDGTPRAAPSRIKPRLKEELEAVMTRKRKMYQ